MNQLYERRQVSSSLCFDQKYRITTMVKYPFYLIICFLVLSFFSPAVYAVDLNLWVSKSWHELNENERKEVTSATDKYIEFLKTESYSNAYDNSHPELKKTISKESFINSMQMLKPRFAQMTNIMLSDARIVSFKLKASKKTKIVYSGSAKSTDPEHIEFYTVPGIKKQGLVFYKIQSDTIERLLTLRIGMNDSTYKILSFYLFPSKVKGKGFDYYENLGNNWSKEKKYVTSLYAYLMALRLDTVGQDILTAHSKRLRQKINNFLTNSVIKSQLLLWKVEESDYQILKFDILETIKDVSPTIAYISKFQLEKDSITKESNMLLAHIKKMNPNFGDHFEAILFQAYSENPISPKKQYPFYRVALRIN
jgi:hypothetical protein